MTSRQQYNIICTAANIITDEILKQKVDRYRPEFIDLQDNLQIALKEFAGYLTPELLLEMKNVSKRSIQKKYLISWKRGIQIAKQIVLQSSQSSLLDNLIYAIQFRYKDNYTNQKEALTVRGLIHATLLVYYFLRQYKYDVLNEQSLGIINQLIRHHLSISEIINEEFCDMEKILFPTSGEASEWISEHPGIKLVWEASTHGGYLINFTDKKEE